jgi:pyruvate dehydrogenase E2 component (dihydrolipoamide acetyltransferase)
MRVSPLAKKLAEDKGLPLQYIPGSGDGGRIVRRDVDAFMAGASVQSASAVESYTEENVSQMRKTIARRLAESKFTAPHFYLTMEINMGRAVEARAAMNAATGSKVSFNDMVVKATALALKQHPKVNSSWQGETIRYNHHVHMGIAVAVEEGLLVPVVRFADTKTLAQINQEVKTFAEKAKTKKLQPSDWEGNTFTISNLGMFGIEEFTAIVNPPDACILAVGAIREVPVVKNGAVVPGHTMKLTLSCDHRVVDGASGSAFLQTLKAMLEEPVLMFI